uniref:soluble epoxide hydrolase n=1 Tax=Euphorbia corallioides TaxID=1091622 RepID=A0A2L0W164_9ROSI|nr:epoxide hydrolase [Euphorbia corallioides]
MDKIEHTKVATNGINMHVASIGKGPPILFLHGYPELWYSWRNQLLSLSSLGYHCIAPDLRGYGHTDAPESVEKYTVFHIVGDLVGLLDALKIEQVFLVAHDWGAIIAWYFCLFRPDRIKALVNTSVPFLHRDPNVTFVQNYRNLFGDDFYIVRYQELGKPEAEYAKINTAKLFRIILTNRNPDPEATLPKDIGKLPDPAILPCWLTEKDVDYYAHKFDQTGFTGGINYYRNLDRTWELTAAWSGAQVKVPTKFIVGDLDLTYNIPGMKEYIHDGGFKSDVPLLEEVIVLKNVAHFLNQEKPDEITNHIYDFIKKF